jgi:hypothetical protein
MSLAPARSTDSIRIDDRLVAGAAAVVARDQVADLVAIGLGMVADDVRRAVSSMPLEQKPHWKAL